MRLRDGTSLRYARSSGADRDRGENRRRHMMRTRIVSGAFATLMAAACAMTHLPEMAAPTGCRASGLWVLERHDSDATPDYWVTIAMAPWPSWSGGFLVADGRGASLRIRTAMVEGDRIAVIGTEDGVDRTPMVFARSEVVPCAFYATGEAETYRLRRER
jgi:hypothetical protein